MEFLKTPCRGTTAPQSSQIRHTSYAPPFLFTSFHKTIELNSYIEYNDNPHKTLHLKATDRSRWGCIDLDCHEKDDLQGFLDRFDALLKLCHGNGWHYQLNKPKITGCQFILVFDVPQKLIYVHHFLSSILEKADLPGIEIYPRKNHSCRLPGDPNRLLVLDRIVEPVVYRKKQAADTQQYANWLDDDNRRYIDKQTFRAHLVRHLEGPAVPLLDTAPRKALKEDPYTSWLDEEDLRPQEPQAASIKSVAEPVIKGVPSGSIPFVGKTGHLVNKTAANTGNTRVSCKGNTKAIIEDFWRGNGTVQFQEWLTLICRIAYSHGYEGDEIEAGIKRLIKTMPDEAREQSSKLLPGDTAKKNRYRLIRRTVNLTANGGGQGEPGNSKAILAACRWGNWDVLDPDTWTKKESRYALLDYDEQFTITVAMLNTIGAELVQAFPQKFRSVASRRLKDLIGFMVKLSATKEKEENRVSQSYWVMAFESHFHIRLSNEYINRVLKVARETGIIRQLKRFRGTWVYTPGRLFSPVDERPFAELEEKVAAIVSA